MYTLKIDRPHLGPGTELQINGLGVVRNGETFEVSDEQAEAFRGANSVPDPDNDVVDSTGALVTVGRKLGPTLLQAFKNDPTVTVETVKTSSSRRQKPDEGDAAQQDLPDPGEPGAFEDKKEGDE